MSIIDEENQIAEGGYTLGALNRHHHQFIQANVESGEDFLSLETGHLLYERGRGVVKTQEAVCSICTAWGLNDGQWHPVPTEAKVESGLEK